jgi:hypothetical protein
MIVRISQAIHKNFNDINVMRQKTTVLKSSSVLALARGRQADWEYQIAALRPGRAAAHNRGYRFEPQELE